MNKLILLTTILFSSATFAASGFSVCEKISSINTTRAKECNNAVRGYDFDINILNLCSKIANSSTSKSVECLKNSADKLYDQTAVDVCIKVAGISTTRAVECVNAIAGKNYDPAEIRVCSKMANSSTTKAVGCLNDGGYEMYKRPNSCEVAESKLYRIERLAHGVLDDLSDMRIRRATNKLVKIIDLATSY